MHFSVKGISLKPPCTHSVKFVQSDFLSCTFRGVVQPGLASRSADCRHCIGRSVKCLGPVCGQQRAAAVRVAPSLRVTACGKGPEAHALSEGWRAASRPARTGSATLASSEHQIFCVRAVEGISLKLHLSLCTVMPPVATQRAPDSKCMYIVILRLAVAHGAQDIPNGSQG